jgi:hypothetical protein
MITDQTHGNRLNSISSFSDLQRRMSVASQSNGASMLPFAPFAGDSRSPYLANMAPKFNAADLPLFIKPLPAKIGPDEVAYLDKKGALTIPQGTLRSEMLRAYIEFVHPYMPLLELHDFLATIDRADGSLGKVSLILYQAVMFAGSAFVDMQHLRAAGYATRKEARKDFFQKTRVSRRPVFRFLPTSAERWRCASPQSVCVHRPPDCACESQQTTDHRRG